MRSVGRRSPQFLALTSVAPATVGGDVRCALADAGRGTMTHVLKAAMRQTKDFVNQHTPAEARVREATSNDAWGAPQTLLQEIAESTYKRDELKETMEMLFKRMNDSSKVRG